MRITRLHLLLALIGLISVGSALFLYKGSLKNLGSTVILNSKPVPSPVGTQGPRAQKSPPLNPSPVDPLRAQCVTSIAAVGEAYRPLDAKFGDIPPIAVPLHAAKQNLAAGKYKESLVFSRQAWTALKAFRQKTSSLKTGSGSMTDYQVVRGDTLWRIAVSHSPTHQGPGWVTIWKANKSIIPDFNRLEVGRMLKIPQRKSQYIMAYWKPRTSAASTTALTLEGSRTQLAALLFPERGPVSRPERLRTLGAMPVGANIHGEEPLELASLEIPRPATHDRFKFRVPSY